MEDLAFTPERRWMTTLYVAEGERGMTLLGLGDWLIVLAVSSSIVPAPESIKFAQRRSQGGPQ